MLKVTIEIEVSETLIGFLSYIADENATHTAAIPLGVRGDWLLAVPDPEVGTPRGTVHVYRILSGASKYIDSGIVEACSIQDSLELDKSMFLVETNRTNKLAKEDILPLLPMPLEQLYIKLKNLGIDTIFTNAAGTWQMFHSAFE